jgi:hypothetical protein
MTHGRHDRQESAPETHTLVAVAAGIASGVAHLLPDCGAGVVIGIRGEWQLVAQRGARRGERRNRDLDVAHARIPSGRARLPLIDVPDTWTAATASGW